MLNYLSRNTLFVIKCRQKNQYKQRMNDKSPHVKSKKIAMSQLSFQNNKKSNAEQNKSQDVEFYGKQHKIPAQECDINDQK